MHRRTASDRLVRALAAAGSTPRSMTPEDALRDACAEPRHPVIVSSTATVRSKPQCAWEAKPHKEETTPDAYEEDAFDADGVAPPNWRPAAEALASRRQEMEERLEEMQLAGHKVRTMLRDIEGIVQRAVDSAPDDDDDDGDSAGASHTEGAGSSTLGVKRPVPAGARLSGSRVTVSAGPSAIARGGEGTSYCAASSTATASACTAVAHLDFNAVKAERLERCEQFESELQPMRHGLASCDEGLSRARAQQERLQATLDSVLSFTDADIEAELRSQAAEIAAGAEGGAVEGEVSPTRLRPSGAAMGAASTQAVAQASALGRQLEVAAGRSARPHGLRGAGRGRPPGRGGGSRRLEGGGRA